VDLNAKRKLVAAVVAAVAVAGGGAAIAATQFGSPKEESQAVVNDAAKQLGVQPSALSDALKTALKNRVDAAVANGLLTKDEGNAIKARIDSGNFPLFGGPFGHWRHLGPFGPFAEQAEAAAKYLGLTSAQLRSRLEGGKTLAQIAKDQGKSVDGLVQTLYDSAKAKADAAVKAGELTKSDEQSLLDGLKARITDLVNGRFPTPPHFGFRHFGGPQGFRLGPPTT
jgi:hypothetical protein